MLTFTLERGEFEDGKGKCPYDPVKGHTGLLVGEWLSRCRLGGSPRTCSHAGATRPECNCTSLLVRLTPCLP